MWCPNQRRQRTPIAALQAFLRTYLYPQFRGSQALGPLRPKTSGFQFFQPLRVEFQLERRKDPVEIGDDTRQLLIVHPG